jgi:hypothetical protein
VFFISTVIKFLGMLVDSIRLAFLIPENKLDKFLALRREILSHDRVDINTLQKFAGKCISFLLAVPGGLSLPLSQKSEHSTGLSGEKTRAPHSSHSKL